MEGFDTESESSGGLNLAQRIRRLANGRASLDVAQFQFIGITEIRDRYGERWAAKRERVGWLARQFIMRRISPEDVLIQGADGFLLVFGAFTGVLADAAAQQITRELNAFFLGEPELDGIQMTGEHRAMTVDDFAKAFGALVSEAREPVRAPELKLSDIPTGFLPIWNAQRGVIATYFVSPLDPETYLPLDWNQQSHRHADMDERKLQQSEMAMRALFASGQKAVVGVAVHVSSLNNQPSLVRLVQTMARFDRELAGYRLLRISYVEPGYPRIYLEDMMRSVRAFAPRIAIGLNWNEGDLGSILKLQPTAVGFTVPPRTLGHTGLKNEVFERIRAAAELARAHNVHVGVEGDLHPEHALRFMQDGVDYVCSPRIWPVRAALPPAETWPAERLLEKDAAA